MAIDLYLVMTREPCVFIRMLAKHIGVEVNLKPMTYDDQGRLPADYSKISPLNKVPAMDDNGFVLYESTAICYYLLNKFAPASPLYPHDLQKRAKVDQILWNVSSFLQPVASSYIRTAIVRRKKLTAKELSAFENTVLRPLQDMIGGKKFVVGNGLTVADIRLVSIMACFVPLPVVDKQKFSDLHSYYEQTRAMVPSFSEVYDWILEPRGKEWETYE
uniref:Glutathione S-transferase n=1 Tax=Amblyomma maculatum TaxID=34609 RepID=G3MQM9_AMBMU